MAVRCYNIHKQSCHLPFYLYTTKLFNYLNRLNILSWQTTLLDFLFPRAFKFTVNNLPISCLV